MKKTQINPWTWQDQYGFSQAWRVEGGQSVIFVSGQSSISADGVVMHGDNFEAQVRLSFENLHAILQQAGASFDDVVKLVVYLVDISKLPIYGAAQAEFFKGKMPAQTVVQVSALALPGMMVEVEAIAVL
ncbi:MAG: RidA family protein [Deltaproteobacteria bacterium]|nr:RidA family protein [Deltaproteobacteria bacterium]